MRFKHLSLLAFLLVVSLILGCSNGEVPVAPATGDQTVDDSRDYNAIPSYTGGHNLGNFKLLLDEEAGTVELIQAERTGQKDVTNWVTIIIEGYHFDPVHRNWEIDARIANNTPYTGWGVLAVFTELGEKHLVGQDGYLYIPTPGGDPKRCPVIAYSKETSQRIFPPGHSDIRKIIIHIPPDVPGLYPVEFFIDAWWPGPRHEPYVEDLTLEPLSEPGSYHIGAHIRDWQTPYSHLLEVKGIIPIDGGDPFVFDLFDDGEHGDGAFNDYLWGADFTFPYPSGKYLLVVKAWDPEDNTFENDIWFHHEGGPPECEPIPHWKIDEGMHGNIEAEDTWVFYHEPPFAEWWQWLKGPDVPPPPIFWQYHQVFGITLGHRPTTGYWIRIDEVCIDHEEDVIHVEYTEMIPGDSCNELQIITQPFIVIGMMRYEDIPVQFHKNEEVYECDDEECLEFETLDHGTQSGYHDPVLKVINCPNAFEIFWQGHKPDDPMPPVNFENHTVVAVVIGDRPTTGYYVIIDWICKQSNDDDAPWVVHFTLHIPADNCPVEEVVTQPYDIVVAEKFEGEIIWEDAHEVYDCPDEDCLDFELLVKGHHSGWHEKNTKVITCPVMWENFWNVHAPGTDPPQINWDDYMIVALAMGDYPTTGYWVHLDEICWCDNEDAWRIDYTIEIPGDSCEVLQIITQPYAYYVVERADGEFFFIEHEHVYECDD